MKTIKLYKKRIIYLLFTSTLLFSCTSEPYHELERWKTMELSNSEIKSMALSHNDYLSNIYKNLYDFNSSKNESQQFKDIKISLIKEFAPEDEYSAYSVFFDNVKDVNLEELFQNDFEIQYVSNIKKALNTATNHSSLVENINEILIEIDSDDRDFFKTPLKLYAQAMVESSYYWWSEDIGGSGIGYKILKRRGKKMAMKTMRDVVETDAKALSAGMIGLAAYGSWGLLFGPVGFALTGASFIGVVVGSAFSSAVF